MLIFPIERRQRPIEPLSVTLCYKGFPNSGSQTADVERRAVSLQQLDISSAWWICLWSQCTWQVATRSRNDSFVWRRRHERQISGNYLPRTS